MFEDSPIKKILFDKLVEMERLPPNPSESTIQTINDISDSEALQLLRSVGVGPTISKAGGGMMNIDEMIRPIGMAGAGLPKEEQATASGTHPLVVFKEMYDQYRIDGVPIAGEKEPLSFKDFFEIIQIQLDNQASS